MWKYLWVWPAHFLDRSINCPWSPALSCICSDAKTGNNSWVLHWAYSLGQPELRLLLVCGAGMFLPVPCAVGWKYLHHRWPEDKRNGGIVVLPVVLPSKGWHLVRWWVSGCPPLRQKQELLIKKMRNKSCSPFSLKGGIWAQGVRPVLLLSLRSNPLCPSVQGKLNTKGFFCLVLWAHLLLFRTFGLHAEMWILFRSSLFLLAPMCQGWGYTWLCWGKPSQMPVRALSACSAAGETDACGRLEDGGK